MHYPTLLLAVGAWLWLTFSVMHIFRQWDMRLGIKIAIKITIKIGRWRFLGARRADSQPLAAVWKLLWL